MSKTLFDLKNVHFTSQNKSVITNLNCTIKEGLSYSFVGSSGSGKSTALKLTAGLIVPTRGKVLFKEQDVSNMTRKQNLDFRKQTSFVFQDSALWANQNIQQILELPLKIHFPTMALKERIALIQHTLAEIGYKKDLHIRPAALSTGEQKLIAFARALIINPKIIFLDEWTESLDDKAARKLVSIIKQKKQEGCTIIFVSHTIAIIHEIAEILFIIDDGYLSQTISIEEFKKDKALERSIKEGAL